MLQIFKKASDKKPQNERLEVGIGDTGCTTSCIPLSVAKTHNLKISKVKEDKPDMRSYIGSGMKVVGQTKFYIKIKTRKGYTSKKLLHCLVVNHSYDHEILISWDNCILFGIIPENFPYCFLDDDSDSANKNVKCDKEEENPEIEE